MSLLDISSNKFESLKAPWKEMATWHSTWLEVSDHEMMEEHPIESANHLGCWMYKV